MLLRNSSEYIKEPKEVCMMDLFPLSETEKVYPRGTPKVLNTHYGLHVLPKEFHNQKTVLGKDFSPYKVTAANLLIHILGNLEYYTYHIMAL